LSSKAREEFKAKLQLQPQQEVVFTTYTYDTNVYSKKEQLEVSALTAAPILLVTGIADPLPLCEALKAQGIAFEHKRFSDHHNFSTQEVAQLKSAAVKRKVLTTEKDFMRLAPLWGEEANLFYWPIQLGFVTPADEQLIQDWLATVK
jgi:tetraacyldisaccharide 4'-kinase